MNASLSTKFVTSYPYYVFTELNVTVARLSGATSLRDKMCSDLLALWMSLSPLIRARFTEAMDHPLVRVGNPMLFRTRMFPMGTIPAGTISLGTALEQVSQAT